MIFIIFYFLKLISFRFIDWVVANFDFIVDQSPTLEMLYFDFRLDNNDAYFILYCFSKTNPRAPRQAGHYPGGEWPEPRDDVLPGPPHGRDDQPRQGPGPGQGLPGPQQVRGAGGARPCQIFSTDAKYFLRRWSTRRAASVISSSGRIFPSVELSSTGLSWSPSTRSLWITVTFISVRFQFEENRVLFFYETAYYMIYVYICPKQIVTFCVYCHPFSFWYVQGLFYWEWEMNLL